MAPIVVSALMLGTVGPPVQGNPRDRKEWWINTYHRIDRSDPRAMAAQAVFDRLQDAVDERAARRSELVIVNADGDPFAIALPDRSIVLTRGALTFCYGQPRGFRQPNEPGDLRLGFVLGHELAHLSSEDFWHEAAFAAAERFRTRPGSRRAKKRIFEPPMPEEVRKAELKADYDGAITMTMAGYSAGDLFGSDPDFFQRWVGQAGIGPAYDDPAHPPPEVRADFLRSQLTELVSHLDLFHFGVRMAEVGRYDIAIALLERFSRVFEGREVLNDLGYANYQLGIQRLAACDGAGLVRFRLPVAIDDETLVNRVRLRGPSPTRCLESEVVRKTLGRARDYLKEAIDKDSTYLPARYNLLAVELVSDNAGSAYQLAKETLVLAPRDGKALLAKGISEYLIGVEIGVQSLDVPLATLREAEEADHALAADVAWARAVMYLERGRRQEEEKNWRKFLELEPSGSQAELARERISPDSRAAPRPAFTLGPGPRIPLGIVLPTTRAELAKLQRRQYDDLGDQQLVVYGGSGLQVLQLGNAVVMVEEAASRAAMPPKVPQTPAVVRVETLHGSFLRYPGVGFDVEANHVRAVVYFAPAR